MDEAVEFLWIIENQSFRFGFYTLEVSPFLGLQFGCLTNSLKEPWCFFETPMVWLQRFQRGIATGTNETQMLFLCFLLFVAIAADQILQPHMLNAVTPRYAATPMFGWWVVVTASCLLFVQRLAAAAHCKHWWTSKASRVLWLRLGLPQRDRPLLQMIGMFQKSFLCSFASHSFLRHLRLNLSCINKWT